MAEDSKNENGEKKTSGKPTDPCLLIDYVQELAQKSFDEYNSFGRSNFKTIDVDPKVTPASIISSMTSRGGLSEFLEMDNTTLGLLVPKVKLFKQYYESEMDTVGKSVEFLFDDSFDRDRINAITLSGLARSGGAGIKEVNWEVWRICRGQDPQWFISYVKDNIVPTDVHESEWQWAKLDFDCVIHNNDTIIDLKNQVSDHLASNAHLSFA